MDSITRSTANVSRTSYANNTLSNHHQGAQERAGLTSEAGIKNIEGWETYLKDHDAPAVKAIVADLQRKLRGETAGYVTSVCSGSTVLGAAGLLEGYKSTTH